MNPHASLTPLKPIRASGKGVKDTDGMNLDSPSPSSSGLAATKKAEWKMLWRGQENTRGEQRWREGDGIREECWVC
jgi:hypothetical protein